MVFASAPESTVSRISKVSAHDVLRVSLDDLRSAESKGKWWLVGAAWGGDPLVEARDNMADIQVNGQDTKIVNDTTSYLLKLARKQGMNTDIRRSIFVILMSSDVSHTSSIIFFSEQMHRIMLTPMNAFHNSI